MGSGSESNHPYLKGIEEQSHRAGLHNHGCQLRRRPVTHFVGVQQAAVRLAGRVRRQLPRLPTPHTEVRRDARQKLWSLCWMLVALCWLTACQVCSWTLLLELCTPRAAPVGWLLCKSAFARCKHKQCGSTAAACARGHTSGHMSVVVQHEIRASRPV